MASQVPLLVRQPQYALVAQSLAEDIVNQRYPVGSLLPSEHELCKLFDVSRHTVREAIRRLAEQGMVTRQRGIGTTVKAAAPTSRYVQATAATIDLPRYVEDTRLVKTATTEVTADESLAALLKCPVGKRWIKVDAYRLVDRGDLPMALTSVYISAAYGKVHRLIGTVKIPVYSMIEREFGINITEVQQEISAVLIDADDAKQLGVASKSAGLAIVRRYVDEGNRTVEVATNLHPAERFSYSMLVRLPPPHRSKADASSDRDDAT